MEVVYLSLNIEPFLEHSAGRNCIEHILMSVFKSWNYHYELLFSESWNFRLDQSPHLHLVGSKIVVNKYYANDLLQNVHGIRLQQLSKRDSTEVFEIIKTQLAKQYPVLIYLNSYWTPWGNPDDYQIQHNPHFVLVTGIDENKKMLHCVDPVFSTKVEHLSFEFFLNGNNGNCTLIEPYPATNEQNWQEILDRLANQLLRTNRPHDIQTLSSQFLEQYDIQQETNGYDDLWKAPIGMNITRIIFGRRGFLDALHFLNKQLHTLDEIIDKVTDILNRWNVVNNLITKSYFLMKLNGKGYNFRKNIAEKLSELTTLEANFMDYLSTQPYRERYHAPIKRENKLPTETNTPEKKTQSGDIVRIDMGDYLNNKGIQLTEQCKADLTMEGVYLILKEPVSDSRWFDFPQVGPDRFDNMSCQGQNINVKPAHYAKIHLLVCSEWGECIEKMTLHYEQHDEVIELKISDWIEKKPKFAEQIYLRLPNSQGHEARLYHQTIDLKPEMVLKGVTFPSYRNLHVFAMSVEGVI